MTTASDNSTELSRIKRGDGVPRFIQWEKQTTRRYPHLLEIKYGRKNAILKYRRSRWRWSGDLKEGVRRRQIFGWLQIKGESVAAIQIFEFAPAPWISNSELLDIMDIEDAIECDLAEVLTSYWNRFADDVTSRGTLVDFRSAWSDPISCPPILWAIAANLLLRREFSERALLTIKAFPLEYEGRVNGDPRVQHAMLRRQKAMGRHYRRLFDVIPFPGDAGDEGWLYQMNPRIAARVPLPSLNDDDS